MYLWEIDKYRALKIVPLYGREPTYYASEKKVEGKRYNPKSKSADHVLYPYGSYTTKPEGIELARAVNRFASLGMEVTLDRIS